jgi:UDP-N-acetylglucosamine 2-epimerase (non-hydrolysing)
MDSYELLSSKIIEENAPEKYNLQEKQYGVVTLHRPSNVDTKESLIPLLVCLNDISEKLELIFAVHPRTKNSLDKFNFYNSLNDNKNIKLIDPISYIPFMSLVRSAKVVITDSGGIQEETTYLDIPCLTLRENTERPITVTQGTNKLVTTQNLSENVDKVLSDQWTKGTKPDFWDGQAALRIRDTIKTILKMQ